MNAAFSALLETRDFDMDDGVDETRRHEKFRMSQRPHLDIKRKRPKQHNGMHRRRRKKIRL